jgi:hypothetical protein
MSIEDGVHKGWCNKECGKDRSHKRAWNGEMVDALDEHERKRTTKQIPVYHVEGIWNVTTPRKKQKIIWRDIMESEDVSMWINHRKNIRVRLTHLINELTNCILLIIERKC